MSTITSATSAEPIVQGVSKAAGSGLSAKDAATQADGRVKVRPVRPYLCSATGEQRAPGGSAYPVEPYQAADLVRNGVAEYDDPADEDAAIEARIKTEAESIRAGRRSRGGEQS